MGGVLEEFAERIGDRMWRLSHLYTIVDKQGMEVPFHPNAQQRELFEHLHTRNVVLKSRQVGLTTACALLALDYALFHKQKNVAIIAHRQDAAKKIFREKIQFAYQRLPKAIRDACPLSTETMEEYVFGNGSSIAVTTSARSGTIQFLIVSEFGYTCAYFPEKAQEIVTGSFNAVPQDQCIIVESTAAGRGGAFFDLVQSAKHVADTERTPLDYRLFFFPWWTESSYRLAARVPLPAAITETLDAVEQSECVTIDPQQRAWYAKTAERLRDHLRSEYPSTVDDAFAVSVEGAYYGRIIDAAIAAKRVTQVPYDPRLPVDTWWDLGMSDDTTIIFVQQLGTEVRVIDCYAASGEGIAHYAKVLNARGYAYGRHCAPHDIAVREIGTGKSRIETAQEHGIHFECMARLPLDDGIEAVRNLLPRCVFDAERTTPLLEALANYRREWDEQHGTFRSKPVHDASSHFADAMRTGAIGLRDTVAVPRTIGETPSWQAAQPEEAVAFDPYAYFPSV